MSCRVSAALHCARLLSAHRGRGRRRCRLPMWRDTCGRRLVHWGPQSDRHTPQKGRRASVLFHRRYGRAFTIVLSGAFRTILYANLVTEKPLALPTTTRAATSAQVSPSRARLSAWLVRCRGGRVRVFLNAASARRCGGSRPRGIGRLHRQPAPRAGSGSPPELAAAYRTITYRGGLRRGLEEWSPLQQCVRRRSYRAWRLRGCESEAATDTTKSTIRNDTRVRGPQAVHAPTHRARVSHIIMRALASQRDLQKP